jgi:choline dehydrogenase
VQYQSDDELARLAGDIATTIFHPVGTTKMGRADDPLAVLDARLRVRGIAGLRVVDAGAMPTITSGNTNSPVLMMAEKAAEWIVGDAAAAREPAAQPAAAGATHSDRNSTVVLFSGAAPGRETPDAPVACWS